MFKTGRQQVAANDAVDDEDNEAAAVDAMGVAPQESFDIFVHYDLFDNCIATASSLLIILTTIAPALFYIIAWF